METKQTRIIELTSKVNQLYENNCSCCNFISCHQSACEVYGHLSIYIWELEVIHNIKTDNIENINTEKVKNVKKLIKDKLELF